MAWNKGLTKDTDARVAKYGKSVSLKKKGNQKYKLILNRNRAKTAKLEGKYSLESVQRLYDELGSQHKLAMSLGVNQSAVSQFMTRHGMKVNPMDIGLRRRTIEQKKNIYAKVSNSMKGNINWRFSHEFPNKEEKKLIYFFDKWKLPFKYVGDGSFKIDGKCPDFIWKERKAIIEYFGELWHEESDESERVELFRKHGWNCLVIWGKEVGWWSLKRRHITYSWERRLYDKIVRWIAGLS